MNLASESLRLLCLRARIRLKFGGKMFSQLRDISHVGQEACREIDQASYEFLSRLVTQGKE